MHEYVIAYQALKKSNRIRTVIECFLELSQVEIIRFSLLLFVLFSFVGGLITFEENKGVLYLTSLFWMPIAYSLMLTLSSLPTRKYGHLKEGFSEIVNSKGFRYEYARLFIFIEYVNKLDPQGVDYAKVENICNVELKSMEIAPILMSPLPTFFIAFLASSLAYAFWQTDNESMHAIGALCTFFGGYLIYLFVTGKSWVHKKVIRLRKYCELISLMSEEQKSALSVKIPK